MRLKSFAVIKVTSLQVNLDQKPKSGSQKDEFEKKIGILLCLIIENFGIF